MQDFWGNPAIDFGAFAEMTRKYKDKLFVSVSNKPFGDSYVLFICDESEEDEARTFLKEYDSNMKSRGITEYGSGVSIGEAIHDRNISMFMGGAYSGL